ncbi:NHL repeat-containing protein [bacterium]|nr:NHL repeat-containing protein [bacterium]
MPIMRCIQIYILLFGLAASVSTQETITKRVREATTLVYPPSRHAPLHKATAVHLFAFMALIGRTDVTPDDPQGLAATRLKSTDDPQNRNDDDDLTVYGVNSGQNNIIFNSSMQSIDIYEGKGPKQKLRKPRGIACNSDGDVYIADSGNNRVVKLLNPGSYLTFVDAFGKRGSKPAEFNEPSGIALGTDGRIFVTDTGNDRIQVFDKNMKFLYALGDKNDSTGLAVSMVRPDAIAFADPTENDLFFKEEFITVIDLNNTRIRKLTPDGQFIAGVNSTDYGYQQVYLTSVAVDYYSNIWVTDMFNHCVHKFDRHLNYIARFGNIGDGDNQFFEPRGIAIGRNYGQVFINDKKSAQYFHIGTDIIDLKISLQDSSIRFDFMLTEHSKITARIFDDKNSPVGLLCLNKSFSVGNNSLVWNRQLVQGTVSGIFPNDVLKRRLAADSSSFIGHGAPKDSGITALPHSTAQPGLYKIRIEAKTNYIYNRYFTKQVEVEFAF